MQNLNRLQKLQVQINELKESRLKLAEENKNLMKRIVELYHENKALKFELTALKNKRTLWKLVTKFFVKLIRCGRPK